LAIARAFLADPAVLVLDEATGAVDPATEAQVMSGYEAVMRGRTTIVITHRLEPARRADRVVVLDRGRIVEAGVADSLMATGGAFAELFGTLQPTA
jgi:ATP-binding cassette subfamily B protein